MLNRKLLPVAGGLIAAFISVGCARPSSDPTGTPIPAPTPVSEGLDDPLLPPFTPSYPCELQNDLATVSDESYCRSEEISEVVAAEGDGAVFIQHTHHLGYGCWTGINTYEYAFYACDTTSGARALLADQPTTALVPSPDGEWLAFGVIDRMNFDTSVHKIRIDGSDKQRIDTQPFPESTVGINVVRWSADGDWIDLSLWDGTEDGWHAIRLKADGSGQYEIPPGEK